VAHQKAEAVEAVRAVSRERRALAEAFAGNAAQVAAAEALARAIDPAQRAVWAALDAVDDADPEAARRAGVKHLMDVARGIDSQAPRSALETRVALAAAQDELEVRRAVLAKIQEEHQDLSAWPSRTWGKLQEAANAVLRVESGPDKQSITSAMCTATVAALIADPAAPVTIGWASWSTPLPPDRR